MQKQLFKGMNGKEELRTRAYSKEQAEYILNLRVRKKFGYSNVKDVRKVENESPSNKNIS
jgi:hypothetical protein